MDSDAESSQTENEDHIPTDTHRTIFPLPFRHRRALARAEPPVLYDVPYDKLVGHDPWHDMEERLTSRYIDSQGRELPQSARYMYTRENHNGLPLGKGNRYLNLGNRDLVEMRQARALAGLDTDDMDLAIAQRVLHNPSAWGNLGSIMVEATVTLHRNSIIELRNQ